MIQILVVEDNLNLNQIVCSCLINHGYEVVSCLNGLDALTKMEETTFQLIISDIMMPGMDGFQFAEQVRSMDKLIPILFMTARDDMPSKSKGYRLGIDDYMVKPVVLEELLLRISALLRRANIMENKKIIVGDFMMDAEEHMAYLNNEELPLTVREFDILYKLLSYPKKTFTRSQLMELFWDYDSSATSRTVDVYMAKLREKTSACKSFEIITVHGLGYKLVLQ